MSQTQVETRPSTSNIPNYIQVAETTHELDWADLVTLDLSQFDIPGGKQKLAAQLFDAINEIGFFYIINFGLSQDEVDQQFAIGKEFFELPDEEKRQYRSDIENGGYNGYKPAGTRELKPGIYDNTEIYNIPKFTSIYARSQPAVLRDRWPVIERFGRHIHDSIVSKLLILFAIILELPDDYFLERHRYEEKSDCHLRYMKYHSRPAEVNAALDGVWSKGHTDFGSCTLLFRQPIAALQVRTPSGEWKYVKPYPESITVNIADSLSFLTNGFLKSSIHRVVAPPPDQAHLDRLGVLYFVRAEDDLQLRPVDSAVMKRLGYTTAGEGEGMTAGEWVRARVKTNVGRGKQSEEEIVKGVKAKYYD